MSLQKQIKEVKEENRIKRESSGSKKGIEDKIIQGLKQAHDEEINRLKREIHKKGVQAVEL